MCVCVCARARVRACVCVRVCARMHSHCRIQNMKIIDGKPEYSGAIVSCVAFVPGSASKETCDTSVKLILLSYDLKCMAITLFMVCMFSVPFLHYSTISHTCSKVLDIDRKVFPFFSATVVAGCAEAHCT